MEASPADAFSADWPNLTLEVSEVFSSVQGEGASAEIACLFVRLALCNLRCGYCDTKYTWDFRTYRYEDEVSTRSAAEILEAIVRAPERRVVITGGEPLVQRDALSVLLARVPSDVTIEIETNGTLPPTAALLERVDQWNVSPKLSHSGESEQRRLRFDVLEALRETGRAWLKLVVRGAEDLDEVDALVTASGWPRERVLLMPEVTTRAEYHRRAEGVAAIGRRRGYGFSPRLHVLRWDGARGR
jgi:7-carboxy-7-deazaguanine synthase